MLEGRMIFKRKGAGLYGALAEISGKMFFCRVNIKSGNELNGI